MRPRRGEDAERHAERGEERDRSEVEGRRLAEQEAPEALARPRVIGDVDLESAPALTDQVVSDVGGERRKAVAHGVLAGALDGSERHPDLGFAVGLGQLFDGVPVAVAAAELHASVDAGRVALKDLLHDAHTARRNDSSRWWRTSADW
jgi:hypothetical protein